MTSEDAPKIEFPCDYPIKVMGLETHDFRYIVVDIIRRHAPDLDDEQIDFRASRNGKYLSVKATITATGTGQLKALFEELKASGRVIMVL